MDLFEEGWLRSMPIGLVMFLGTALAFARRAWVRNKARSSFPQLASQWGLEHLPPESPGAAGTLKGRWSGFTVRVESDARARVVVLLAQPVPLDIRNYERWVRLPPGHTPFAWGDRRLDSWLRTRLAAPEVATAITSDPVLPTLLERLHSHPSLREFSVSEGRLEAVYDFGARGLFPVPEVETALRSLVEVAKRLETLFPESVAREEGLRRDPSAQPPP